MNAVTREPSASPPLASTVDAPTLCSGQARGQTGRLHPRPSEKHSSPATWIRRRAARARRRSSHPSMAFTNARSSCRRLAGTTVHGARDPNEQKEFVATRHSAGCCRYSFYQPWPQRKNSTKTSDRDQTSLLLSCVHLPRTRQEPAPPPPQRARGATATCPTDPTTTTAGYCRVRATAPAL